MKKALLDSFFIFRNELRSIFSDPTIIVLFFVGTLLYPLLYSWIYDNEALQDMPVAVADLSHTPLSRDFIRRLDATPELSVTHRALSLHEAQEMMERREVHGVVLIPSSFGDDVNRGIQTTVPVYADMSGFIYYKGLLTAVNYAGQSMGGEIQVKRLMAAGTPQGVAMAMVDPVPAVFTPLYNPGGGYASFLIPAVLLLVIHQTLLIGICVLAGTNREQNKLRLLVPMSRRYHGTLRIMGGKSLAYLSIYLILVFYVLFLVPRWFGLPHLGNTLHIYLFLLPFLLATIFFGMTVSVAFRDRETPMLILLFLSVPLLFLSGVVWPLEDMPLVWRTLAYMLPSTHGVQGFVKMSSMGATLSQVRSEYLILCIQAGIYLIITFFLYRYQIIRTGKAVKDLALPSE